MFRIVIIVGFRRWRAVHSDSRSLFSFVGG
jgi:hypothetical protein